MITAEQKPIEEIMGLIGPYKKVLVLGCNSCVAECAAGGEKEAAQLASLLKIAARLKESDLRVEHMAVERQCVRDFLLGLEDVLSSYDAVVSLGCGAGAQSLSDLYRKLPVIPGLNTGFLGETVEQGVWSESCLGCNDCMLYYFGGICPLARCSKQLLNGPCGGSQGGMCEVGGDVPCAWHQIIERLSGWNALERLSEIYPPKDWSKKQGKGPRKIIREDQKR